MISYAGVHLGAPYAANAAAVEAAIDPQTLHDAERSLWPGSTSAAAVYPYLDGARRPVRLNTLFWPVGASRWAFGRFLVDDARLAAIRDAVYGGTDGYQAATLYIDDGVAGRDPVETEMYLLPPRPVFQAGPPSGLWLITLVDDRWFWWQRSGEVTVTEGTTTWADVYSQIGTLLGVTLDAEAVAAAYLTPSSAVVQRYGPLPMLLDAVAFQVGHRIVRDWDTGEVRTVSATTDRAVVDLNLAVEYPVHRGGLFDVQRPPSSSIDIPSRLPASVVATFPRKAGSLTGEYYAVTVTLASLALAEADGRSGHPGSYYARLQTRALGGSGTPTNSASLATLASQFAADWYRWQLANVDVLLGGDAPWAAEGFHDVEWSNRPGDCFTRVRPAEIVTPLEESPAGAEPRIWAKLTDYENFAYSWVEAEPITPTSGAFATNTGTSFQVKSGGRSGTLNLYERNRAANVFLGAYVQIYPGAGDTWLFEFEQDHFTGTIRGGTGPSYTVEENNAGDNARTVTATEFNGTEDIPLGTVVQVWVYTASDGSLTYQFAYELQDCAACVSITTVNVTNIYDYTADPGTWYYNEYNDTLYVYIDGVGWKPLCCPTGTGSGSGTSGAGGSVVNACCPGGIPNTLYAHPTQTAGTCEFPFPDPTPLYFQGASATSVNWISDCYYDAGNGCYGRLAMACYSAGPHAGQVGMGAVKKAPDSCSPFSTTFTGVVVVGVTGSDCLTGSVCCDGSNLATYDITVNTTP